ncbi:MAG: hypothetical protein LBG66_02715 [Gallionellaceae bacterium]|jgi:hypothetical protein|nr:hypothetical protein [Gallionellaceae bacterium]
MKRDDLIDLIQDMAGVSAARCIQTKFGGTSVYVRPLSCKEKGQVEAAHVSKALHPSYPITINAQSSEWRLGATEGVIDAAADKLPGSRAINPYRKGCEASNKPAADWARGYAAGRRMYAESLLNKGAA